LFRDAIGFFGFARGISCGVGGIARSGSGFAGRGDFFVTDPIAVLLIIGSAVVGPIQGQDCWTAPGYQSDERGRLHQGVRVCEGPMLTLAEVCERAMKEIGAHEAFKALPSRMENWALDDGQRVTCIPAPSGLKR
jgi:hypothetical protein